MYRSSCQHLCSLCRVDPTHAHFVYYENADLVYDVIRMRQLSKQIYTSYRQLTIHNNHCFSILFCWTPRLKQGTSTKLSQKRESSNNIIKKIEDN